MATRSYLVNHHIKANCPSCGCRTMSLLDYVFGPMAGPSFLICWGCRTIQHIPEGEVPVRFDREDRPDEPTSEFIMSSEGIQRINLT